MLAAMGPKRIGDTGLPEACECQPSVEVEQGSDFDRGPVGSELRGCDDEGNGARAAGPAPAARPGTRAGGAVHLRRCDAPVIKGERPSHEFEEGERGDLHIRSVVSKIQSSDAPGACLGAASCARRGGSRRRRRSNPFVCLGHGHWGVGAGGPGSPGAGRAARCRLARVWPRGAPGRRGRQGPWRPASLCCCSHPCGMKK